MRMIHDPAAFYDEATGNYYIYSTGAIGQVSKDLVHFTPLGQVVPKVPPEAKEWTKSDDIWAPDIVKVGDEYRLYCSNSSWGVQRSCIFLAVSHKAEGPFEPRGIVLKTDDCLPVNAIDANIITDVDTGEMYMLYGSFWGGAHVLPLDPKTGLAKSEASANWTLDEKTNTLSHPVEDIIGTCVARRPSWMSGALEGPYMIYHPKYQYYYLFVSYGSLKSDYQIRVGRSKSITGPFVDWAGRGLTDLSDGRNQYGNLIMAGYQWNDGVPYMAPGHNSVLRDANGEYYVVAHIRKKDYSAEMMEPSQMQLRKLFFSEDGWPYTAPQPYRGELQTQISEEELIGFYERVDLVPTLPQGISTATPMRLGSDGYYEHCSIQGSWNLLDKQRIAITYGPHREEVRFLRIYDTEREVETIGLCGISEDGICFWAKKVSK